MTLSKRVALTVALAVMVGAAANPALAGGQKVVGPGDSIQAAVDKAKPGETIVVLGTHRENVAIATDGITLRGVGAALERPATPQLNACFDGEAFTDVNGVCVIGTLDLEAGEVVREVRNVTVTGFTIRGFDLGIVAFGAHDATFAGNVAADNGEYGITAFASSGTRILFNRASGSDEAGLYIGDSPTADATLIGNEVSGNLFGVLVRNAEHGAIAGNSIHDNCAGVALLADAPGPTGSFKLAGNSIAHNTKACPAGEDLDVPLSGVGIALVGANDVSVLGNLVTGNAPSADTEVAGGIIVATGDGGTPSSGNTVRGNLLRGNAPDLVWDGAGSGNVFAGNLCRTSDPAGLCG